jgi:predicted dehydrogenase
MAVEASTEGQPGSGAQARRIGVVMNGVTGRMGTNQHLVRSILAIRRQGGVGLPDGARLMPDPLLVGRNEEKLKALADEHELERYTTDLEDALSDPAQSVYFDAQTTAVRAGAVERAIAAGKHVYCEKPSAPDLDSAVRIARQARDAGVVHGVVQDKLFLPGMRKLRALVDGGFFGRILSVRGEFGYWVFEGPKPLPQRPSWNYRAEDGGGIVADMFSHWRYVIDHLIAPIRSVCALGATHVDERTGEDGRPYRCTAEDAAYSIFELEGGVVAQLNSSWCVRVDRDELFELQVDGTAGSAVAGLRDCRVQTREQTPRAVWNPDLPNPLRFRDGWEPFGAEGDYDNAFKAQWEQYLRHVATGTPFVFDLFEGAKGVQLAELADRSWRERRALAVPELPA